MDSFFYLGSEDMVVVAVARVGIDIEAFVVEAVPVPIAAVPKDNN